MNPSYDFGTEKRNCDGFLEWATQTSKKHNDMLRPEMWIALASIWKETLNK